MQVVEFLAELYKKGLSYSALLTAKSAVCSLLEMNTGIDMSKEKVLVRAMRGAFNARPALPRYKDTWDVNILINYLRSLPENKDLTLRILSMKLAILFLLLLGQRLQTLTVLDTRNILVTDAQIRVAFGDLLKNSRPNYHLAPQILKAYPNEKKLCIVQTYNFFLEKTKQLRGESTAVFLRTTKPYTPAKKDTMANWIRFGMSQAGIDTKEFRPHSIRSASTSKAAAKNLPIADIMKAAGWSSPDTFLKFYHKSVQEQPTFSEVVLL